MIKSVYSKMAQFTLYYTPSSTPSRTVLMLIKNMDLNVELKKVNLLEKEHFTEEYLKVNPQHCVPMINDNGFYLWESRAIITYLINTRSPGHSLYPVDPKQRALIDQRLYFDAATLVPRIRAICYSAIHGNGTEIKEADREKLYDAFDLLDKFLEGKIWFAGDNVTIADLSILSSISAIKEVGANINKFSNLAGWYEKCKGLPGFDEVESGAILYRDRVRKNLVGDL